MIQCIQALVKDYEFSEAQAKIGPFAPLAGVLYIALFVALGHVTEACLEQIPGPKFLEPFVEPAFFALADLDDSTFEVVVGNTPWGTPPKYSKARTWPSRKDSRLAWDRSKI